MTDDPDPRHSRPADIAIAVRTHSPLWRAGMPDAPGVVERAARAALAGAQAAGSLEVSFLLANDARVRRLNRDFRDQDKPTNVLSFPAEDGEPMAAREKPGTGPRLLGDVVFALRPSSAKPWRNPNLYPTTSATSPCTECCIFLGTAIVRRAKRIGWNAWKRGFSLAWVSPILM